MPTAEWLQHYESVVEDRDVHGTKGVRNITQTAFDRYFRRNLLMPGDKKTNAALYVAGEQFRADWERARLDLMARPSFERTPRGAEEFTMARLEATARVRAAMVKMGAARDAVVDCVVFGHAVGRARMEVLRLGLATLVEKTVDS